MFGAKLGIVNVVLSCLALVSESQKKPITDGSRSVLIQMFEWPFKSLSNECNTFLGPLGYAGIQVSPVSENLIITDPERPWYERYQVMSYKIQTRSGNEQDFRSMIGTCNKVGVRTYVDVVFNHMTGSPSNATGTAGSTANPQQRDYPAVPYNISNFHTCNSDIDYDNATSIRVCELVGLHDLDQSQAYVRQKIIDFLNNLIDMGAAGFRVDVAKNMYPSDLQYIFSQVHNLNTSHGFAENTRPYIYQEIKDYGTGAVRSAEYIEYGQSQEHRYVSLLRTTFRQGGSFNKIVGLGNSTAKNMDPDLKTFLNSSDASVLVDDHDTQREDQSLCHNTPALCEMATAFMLSFPYGSPIIFSGFAFSDNDAGPPHDSNYNILDPGMNCSNGWTCEHRWSVMQQMVKFRQVVGDSPLENIRTYKPRQVAFSRRSKGFVAFNLESEPLVQSVQTSLPAGTYCDAITGGATSGNRRCQGIAVIVDSNSFANLTLPPLQPEAYQESQPMSTNINGLLAIGIHTKINQSSRRPNIFSIFG